MVRAQRPAPVSGPGRLSQRTDQAPQNQPVRLPTGQPQGERKALREQQQAAPMQSDDPDATGEAPMGLQQGVFGASQRPSEPITAGAAIGPGRSPSPPGLVDRDPDLLLRAMYKKYPHPDIERMLLRRRKEA